MRVMKFPKGVDFHVVLSGHGSQDHFFSYVDIKHISLNIFIFGYACVSPHMPRGAYIGVRG